MADDEEKTEDPTSKRKSEARKKGQVAKSQDLSQGITLLFATLILWLFSQHLGKSLYNLMTESFLSISTLDLTTNSLIYYSQSSIKFLGILLLPMMFIMMVFGVASNVLQIGWLFTTEFAKPKFGKMFGPEAFKKLVSVDKLAELIKSIFKMIIVGVVGFQVISSHYHEALYLPDQTVFQIVMTLLSILLELVLKVAILLIVMGIIDFFYQKYKTNKSIKMTKHEVKDEAKQADGDPKIKAKIRSLRNEMHRKMMMDEVPKATVVVTNPTFIAIAIRYKQGEDAAPKIIAMGKRIIAEKIKRVALENDIPIVEDKPLARSLFEVAEVGQDIPKEFFGAVAEILAYVYNLQGKQAAHAV